MARGDVSGLRADDRLRRLLAVVPWVASREGPTLDEVCARFHYREQELLDDLQMLFMCGLHPYTPDMLIDVDIAEGRVWIRYAEYFAHPLRLTPAEGLALVAAGRSMLGGVDSDPDGPLARGLAKLAAVLGVDGEEALDVDLGSAPEGVMSVLRAAVSGRQQVQIDYYSYGRDEWSLRTVDPYHVFSAGGQWYATAWCHAVDDERLFRLDRIRSATLLDSRFVAPDRPPELGVFSPDPEDSRVTLELEPGARWVVEQYPVESVDQLDGQRLRVRMAVTSRGWLERLLLRLGPSARVVDGDGRTGPNAACRLLGRYRPLGSG